MDIVGEVDTEAQAKNAKTATDSHRILEQTAGLSSGETRSPDNMPTK